MTIRNAMRVLSVFAVMLAGSCAAPMNYAPTISTIPNRSIRSRWSRAPDV